MLQQKGHIMYLLLGMRTVQGGARGKKIGDENIQMCLLNIEH